jgi:hypothetical protein
MGNPQQGQAPQGGDGIFYRRKRPMSARRTFIVRFFYFALLVSVFAGILTVIARAVKVSGKVLHHHRENERREAVRG